MTAQFYEIIVLESAERDLGNLFDYLESERSAKFAANFIFEIEDKIKSLQHFPERGKIVEEISNFGMSEYRQIYFRNYLVIYKIFEAKVYVVLVTDGRRDMQAILEQRILGR